MSENDRPSDTRPSEADPTDPPAPAMPATPAPAPVAARPSPALTRLRDRVVTLRAAAAVALAGLIIGAGGGTAITLVADDDGPADHGRHERFGPGGGPGERGDLGWRRRPGCRQDAPGQGPRVPPGTAPDEQESPSGAPPEERSSS